MVNLFFCRGLKMRRRCVKLVVDTDKIPTRDRGGGEML